MPCLAHCVLPPTILDIDEDIFVFPGAGNMGLKGMRREFSNEHLVSALAVSEMWTLANLVFFSINVKIVGLQVCQTNAITTFSHFHHEPIGGKV